MHKYHTGLNTPCGYVGMRSSSVFAHKFGFSSATLHYGFVFVLILDLNDNRLSNISSSTISHLTIVYPLSAESTFTCVEYTILDNSHIRDKIGQTTQITAELISRLGSITLRDMTQDECPVDEASYWKSCDSILGGSSPIRVLGPPVWINEPIPKKCNCRVSLNPIVSIGYENYKLRPEPLFFGEVCFYAYFCPKCNYVCVQPEPT